MNGGILLVVVVMLATGVTAATLKDYAETDTTIEKTDDSGLTTTISKEQAGIQLNAFEGAYLKLSAANNGGTYALEGDKVVYEGVNISYRIYEKSDLSEFGALEFEAVLKQKPLVNSVSFPIDVRGLVFYHQPPLNEEVQDDNRVVSCTQTDCFDSNGNVVIHRPENVVNSYAVYYDGRREGNEYKSGKVMHIYRPHVVDAAGAETWGTISIADNAMTITVPRKFLDSATYPVTIDPTFGKTSIGASDTSTSALIGTNYLTSEVGDVSSISVYGSCSGCKIVVAIYEYSSAGGGTPTNLLASETTGASPPASADWTSVDLSYTISADTNYWLTFDADDSFTRNYDSVSDGRMQYYDLFSDPAGGDAWDDPAEPWAYQSRATSIYATYTTGGGADSCTPAGSGTWVIENNDDCVLSSDTILAGDVDIQDGTLSIEADLVVPSGGRVLIRKGDGSNYMYIRKSGELLIRK